MGWYRNRRPRKIGQGGIKSASRIAKKAKAKKDSRPVSTYSDFWLDDYMDTDLWGGIDEFKDDEDSEENEHELGLAALVRLAGIKNSISNFVQILTGKSIPVKYHDADSSYTDGKTVTLTGNVLNESFDVTVGLALHEGSHILLTDFSGIEEKSELRETMRKIPLTQVSQEILTSMWNVFGKNKKSVIEKFAPLVDKQITKHLEKIIKWEYLLHGPIGLDEYIADGWGRGSSWGRTSASEVYNKYKTKIPLNVKNLLHPNFTKTKAYQEVRKNRECNPTVWLKEFKESCVDPDGALVKSPYTPTSWEKIQWRAVYAHLFNHGVRYDSRFRRRSGATIKNKLSKVGRECKKLGLVFDEELVDNLWKIHATSTDEGNIKAVFNFHKTRGILQPLYYYIYTSALMMVSHSIHNWVEDRRIDNYVFSTAPGYRGYYDSLYDHYFKSERVSKELKKKKGYRSETWSSYEFSLINILNKDCKLDRLKGLKEIWNILDLKNVGTWATDTMTTDKKAEEVIKIIFGHIKNFRLNFDGVGDGSQNTKGDGGGLTDIVDGSDYDENGEAGEAQKGTTRDFNKQRKFILGDVKKVNLPEAVQKRIDQVGSFDATLQLVGREVNEMTQEEGYGEPTKGIECVVVKKITPAVVASSGLSCFHVGGWYHYNENVARGLKKGYVLGRKLQVRNEERSTVFNRKKQGKIDKRLINSLGYGNESIFSHEIIDKYKKTHLHLTIDNSGSMGGSKFGNALESAVAIAKAAEMVSNIEVVISFRYAEELPILVVGYDSRVQKLSQATWGLGSIHPSGTTPEGLTFEVIDTLIPTASRDLDVYFVNFSDGAPMFSANGFYYSGDVAYKHTARQVKKLLERGVDVISYYICGGYGWGGGMDWFKEMYGKHSEEIDVTNIFQVAKTLNARFLRRYK